MEIKEQVNLFCSFCLDTPHKAGVNFTNQKIKTVKKFIVILKLAALKSFELVRQFASGRIRLSARLADSNINDF
jgi:hypothetical protein